MFFYDAGGILVEYFTVATGCRRRSGPLQNDICLSKTGKYPAPGKKYHKIFIIFLEATVQIGGIFGRGCTICIRNPTILFPHSGIKLL